MAHPRHDEVRRCFNRCCGYCGISEDDAGGEFTVDHYTPIAAGGDEGDENLVYCCFRCNLYKGDFTPSDHDRAVGHMVLHPSRHDPSQHLRRNEATGQLEALTETGRFHITLLRLNRPALVGHRLRQRHAELRAARQQLLEAENPELRAIIAAQQKYIDHLRRLLGEELPRR